MLAELIIALVILFSSGFLLFETAKFPATRIASIGPEYWPQIILTGMVILSFLLIIKILRSFKECKQDNKVNLPNSHNFWIAVAAVFLYTKFLPILGFPVTSLLFIVTMLWVLKIRRWQWLSFYSLSLTLGLIMLFPKLMSVPLPRGTGIFRTITLFFY
ncbi:tripartite tricarboxylate transporter TctB family protein [Desulfitibacter alkalitolerans]|uniref:tripartite tricarboxylate transporter TctB family protein n=1 Tax=Desulfitibacter alkalitolerans TaxID=264641 RepID=UPI00047FE029|nr:tripartite tricarboxylate transporter TctB family protein [Desulfitibacter alkalitolerans]